MIEIYFDRQTSYIKHKIFTYHVFSVPVMSFTMSQHTAFNSKRFYAHITNERIEM